MGSLNDLNFVKANAKIVSGLILDVGSKDYANTPDYRLLFPGCEYVGIDLEEGKGVDVVLDLTSDFDLVSEKLGGKRFKTVFCFSILEHCKNPFKMCSNISQLLDKNGILFVSVPFCHQIHMYPSDYWRFTTDGVRVLFPELDFDTYVGNISTGNIGELRPIDNFYKFRMFRADLRTSWGLKLRHHGYLVSIFVYACRKLRILPFIFDYPYLFPAVMVNMIGRKK